MSFFFFLKPNFFLKNNKKETHLAIAALIPSLTRKKPSGVRSPVQNCLSTGSTSEVSRPAPSASVRAMRIVGTPETSAARRAATSERTNWEVGTRTLPPRWPHFFSEESWSSKWTPAAPVKEGRRRRGSWRGERKVSFLNDLLIWRFANQKKKKRKTKKLTGLNHVLHHLEAVEGAAEAGLGVGDDRGVPVAGRT